MKPFHSIAVPHEDILEGRFTLDVFAADLWDTYIGRAPEEYSDAKTFFRKTYSTEGLKNLIDIVESRLTKGKAGDPVIHLQTPFGGGKTHTLIALFHKAKEWKAKPVVIVGSAMSGQETIWGLIENQLTGSIDKLSGNVAPGREALRQVIEKDQPVLILIDELLQYIVKAAGVAVQGTTLAAQTLAFMQELTELAGTLDKTCVVMTLPSSMLEHYDANAEKLYQQLQKIAGRVERIYAPVQENEITKVIRKRLFSSIDETKALEAIFEFLEYAEKEEGMLPAGTERSEYGDRFEESYPFLPEVIETLYHRWGSFPTFQRTRGVLRLLSLVINSLVESRIPYISLSDFNLQKNEIRLELIKHIGPEFNSVISADITNEDSGAKKVDKSLGGSLQGLRLGTRAATAVFMYSFSGGVEKGAHIGEIKRSASTIDNPSAYVAEALEQLRDRLFFLQNQNEKFFFSNQPNLNRILLTKIENIKDRDLAEAEKQLLVEQVKESGRKLRVFLWPDKPKDIPDTEDLKIAILPQKSNAFIQNILETKGDSPRVYRNTIFFLCPLESEKMSFLDSLKRSIAYQQIKNDHTLNLTEEQRKDVEEDLKGEEQRKQDSLRKLHRIILVPTQGTAITKEMDLGIPDVSVRKSIIDEAYDGLKSEGEIIEKISPLVIKERYLKGRDYIKVQQIYDSMMKTPGEVRYAKRNTIEDSLIEGIRQGYFGLGEIQQSNNGEGTERPFCRTFKEYISIIDSNSVIIVDRICEAQRKADKNDDDVLIISTSTGTGDPESIRPLVGVEVNARQDLNLSFDVPRGKISHIMGIMNLLQQKFEAIHLEIKAQKGSISDYDYDSKIKEALRQLGIEIS